MKEPNQSKISSETRYNFSNAKDITNNAKDITNNANSESVVGVVSNSQSVVVSQGSTVSNVTINPSQTSATGISSTATTSKITTHLKRTNEYPTTLGKNREVTELVVKEESNTRLNNNSSNSSISSDAISLIKESMGIFLPDYGKGSLPLRGLPTKKPFSNGHHNFSTEKLPRFNTNNLNSSTPVLSPSSMTKVSPPTMIPLTPSTITKANPVTPSTLTPISKFNIEKELPKLPIEENNKINNDKIQEELINSKKNILKKV